jgi:hypothetical protein
MPDVIPTVATEVLELVQKPPAGELLKVVVEPAHTLAVPVIAAGKLLIVTDAVLKHPVDKM